jgi:hypothetical protein
VGTLAWLRKKMQDNSRGFPTSAREDQDQCPSGH